MSITCQKGLNITPVKVWCFLHLNALASCPISFACLWVCFAEMWNIAFNIHGSLICQQSVIWPIRSWPDLFANMFCCLQIRTSSSEDSLEPVSSQLLPSNCKVLLLADVDGDGSLKLITGHADRVVHVHKLQADQNTEAGVQEELLTGTFGMGI